MKRLGGNDEKSLLRANVRGVDLDGRLRKHRYRNIPECDGNVGTLASIASVRNLLLDGL